MDGGLHTKISSLFEQIGVDKTPPGKSADFHPPKPTLHEKFLLCCGLVKAFTTFLKYGGQVALNFRRKCTAGISMLGVYFDLLGSCCNLCQLAMEGVWDPNSGRWILMVGVRTICGLYGLSVVALAVRSEGNNV